MTVEKLLQDIRAAVPVRFRPLLTIPVKEEIFASLDSGDMVTLGGKVGSGKTTLALAAAYQWIERKAKGKADKGEALERERADAYFEFVTYSEYQFRLRDSYDSNGAGALRDLLATKSILVFDDLFATRFTENAHEEVLHLINERYQWARPTILTTNLSPAKVGETEERIASRIFSGYSIELSGGDRRIGR